MFAASTKESGRFDLPIALGALALAARRGGTQRPLVPPEDIARAAACVAGLDVRAAGSLLQVVQSLQAAAAAVPLRRAQPLPRVAAQGLPDLRDLKDQSGAKRALEIAAAGGHNLLLIGALGSGKSMLATRLPGLLQPMAQDEALASAAQ